MDSRPVLDLIAAARIAGLQALGLGEAQAVAHGIHLAAQGEVGAVRLGPAEAEAVAVAVGGVLGRAVDGAARVYDPIVRGEAGEDLHGVFLKDYAPTQW